MSGGQNAIDGLFDAVAFTRIQALIDEHEATIARLRTERGPLAATPLVLTSELNGMRLAQRLFGTTNQ